MTTYPKLLFPLIFFCSIALSTWAAEPIRLASGEWSPYQSQHLKHFGVASRIVSEAFALAGIQVEYGYFPWARSLENAESGKWDGTFLWFDTPERRKLFYISDPVVDIQYVFFHLKDYPFDWQTVDDLKGIFIGGTLKYDYGETFQSAEQAGTIKVERAPSDELNFKKLLEGRIQIVPNDLDAGFDIIRQHFTPEETKLFAYHPQPVKLAPHHLLLSKKIKRNQQMMAHFNRGLAQLKASGKMKQFLAESRRGAYKK